LNFDWGAMTPQILEERRIEFAMIIVGVVEALPNSKAVNRIAHPLIRSGTAPAPNYDEAQSAASRKVFIHQMKISLKELRETMVWLKIIARKLLGDCREIPVAIAECNALIAIFVSSTKTTDTNGR
jgi:four helix bundle protein